MAFSYSSLVIYGFEGLRVNSWKSCLEGSFHPMPVQSVLKREIWSCSVIYFLFSWFVGCVTISHHWIDSVLSKQPRWWWINQDSSMAALKIIWSQLCTCNPVSRLLTHHSWSFIHEGLFVIKCGHLCFSWERQTFARLSSVFNAFFYIL